VSVLVSLSGRRERVLQQSPCLISLAKRNQSIRLSFIGHERETGIWRFFRDLHRAVKEIHGIFVSLLLLETVSDHFKKTDLAACVAVGHCMEDCAPNQPGCPRAITVKESEYGKLSIRPFHPLLLAESAGDFARLLPLVLGG
jgi:hypothetical protein